jgi:hypothetical protein
MGFVPFGVASAFLMSFGAPFLARGHSRLQKNDAIRVVFAEEINCVQRGNTASDDKREVVIGKHINHSYKKNATSIVELK